MEHDGCKGCKYQYCSPESKECMGCKQNSVDKYKRMTQADRIRAMSGEELAEFIINNCDNPISQKNDDMCDYCEKYEDEKTAECDREGCKKAIVKWLRSEVEE